MITQKKLEEILKYYPETGYWTWKINPCKNVKAGDIAGTIINNRNSIKIFKKPYLASRLAFLYMEGYLPENQVDHKDRNTLNDKWKNLREVSPTCNVINRGKLKNNKSGVTGVHLSKSNPKPMWIANIKVNKNQIYLGSFEKFYEAVKTRWNAEVKYNFPNCNSTSTAYKYLTMKRIKACT